MTYVLGFLLGTIGTVGLLVSIEGRAAPAGALVKTFGNEGSVTLNTGFIVDPPGVQSGVSVKKALALGDRSLLLAGPGVLLKLAPDGALDGRFGNGGVATHGFLDVGGLTVDSHGAIFIAGTETGGKFWSVRKFNPGGGVDEGFVGRLPPLRELRTDLAANATAVVVQPDGAVVALGTAFNQFSQARIVATRWQADGTLDPDFGTRNGTVISGSDFGWSIAGGMVLQPDGKLIISGQQGGCDFGCAWDATVLRLTRQGRPDRSFGTDGWAQSVMPGAGGVSVALQTDGRIVVAAGSFNGVSQTKIARLTTAGDLDSGFGSRGISTIDCDRACTPVGIALQPDGKLVLGATRLNETSLQRANFVAVRLSEDGTVDGSFGRGGFATADFGLGQDQAAALALDPTGAAVVAGAASNAVDNRNPFGVLRFLADGSLDPSFGNRGKLAHVIVPSVEFILRGIALPRGGALIVGAQKTALDGYGEKLTSRLLAVRLTARGALQDRFGTHGVWTYSFGDSGLQALTAAAVEPKSGKLVLGGLYVKQGPNGDLEGGAAVLLRLLPGGRFDTTFAEGGKLLFGFNGVGTSGARVIDLHVNADGSALALTTDFYGGDASVWRIDADGQIDTSFGDGGHIESDVLSCIYFGLGGNAVAGLALQFDTMATMTAPVCRLAVQPDGKLLVAGYVGMDETRPAVQRLRPNGKVDRRFGVEGLAEVAFGPIQPGTDIGAAPITALRLLPDRRVLLAGSVSSPFGAGLDLAFARLRPNGKPDRSFSRDGKAVFNLGTTEHQYLKDVVVTDDGSIVFVGAATKNAFDPRQSDLKPLVGRLTPDGRLHRTFRRGAFRWNYGSQAETSEFSFAGLTPSGTLITAGSNYYSDASIGDRTLDGIAAEWSLGVPAATEGGAVQRPLPAAPINAPFLPVTSEAP